MLSTLDIEASGFGRHGYPIEVGFVRDDGLAWCTLVRPEPEWTHWDAAAEAVHGITRAQLERHGRAAHEVAAQLNAALAGRVVYCDGWAHDYPWLATLFDAADLVPAFRLESVLHLLGERRLPALDPALREERARAGAVRHRASHDARLLRDAVKAVMAAAG